MRTIMRRFNKWVLNPVMMTVAGRRYWYAGVIHHIGRRSGRTYATPVVAQPCDGGYLIPLPYGTEVDWLRNVQTAGGATLQVKGELHRVCRPQIVDAATALPLVRHDVARTWERLGIADYLRVARADLDEPVATARPPAADQRATSARRDPTARFGA